MKRATAVNIPKIINVCVAYGLWTYCTKNKPAKFNGGPGNNGITQPIKPIMHSSMAKIRSKESVLIEFWFNTFQLPYSD